MALIRRYIDFDQT